MAIDFLFRYIEVANQAIIVIPARNKWYFSWIKFLDCMEISRMYLKKTFNFLAKEQLL